MCGICHFTVIDFDNYNKYLYGTLQILVTRSIKKKKGQHLPRESSFHGSIRRARVPDCRNTF